MDSVPIIEIIRHIEEVAKNFSPGEVYTHFYGDLNVDHQTVARATLTAFRPLPKSQISKISAFEIPSSTDFGSPITYPSFIPNYFESVSAAEISSKLLAAKSYGEETPEFPHPRSTESLEALSAVRGSQAGAARAEAFHVYRQVSK
jgi:LmbE family N-acetylglucosaminyl deacetylase